MMRRGERTARVLFEDDVGGEAVLVGEVSDAGVGRVGQVDLHKD